MLFTDGFTSRTLRWIAYDETAQRLYLLLHEPDVVLTAREVPKSLYLAFVQSPSKSAFLQNRVRPFFPVASLSAQARRRFEAKLYREAGQGARSQVLALWHDTGP